MDATATVLIALAGVFINAIGGVVGLTWAVANIKAELTKQITEERDATHVEFNKLRLDFQVEQKVQDHNFGEVGAAVRQYIANVEKEMHEHEIWSRDNYVLKDDFVKATDSLVKSIKDMATDIKSDFREISAKIDKKT